MIEIGLKFVHYEKATRFCEISTLLLSTVHADKSKVETLQNFAAFSEYMNFKTNQKTKEILASEKRSNQKRESISVIKCPYLHV